LEKASTEFTPPLRRSRISELPASCPEAARAEPYGVQIRRCELAFINYESEMTTEVIRHHVT
jgi:hypothetical protein